MNPLPDFSLISLGSTFGASLGQWGLQVVAMLLTALLIPGLTISGPITAFAAVGALAYINTHLWDATLFYQLPAGATVHSAMVLGVNGLLFWGIAKAVPGINVKGLLPALVAPLVFTLTTVGLEKYGDRIPWREALVKGASSLIALRDELKKEDGSSPHTAIARESSTAKKTEASCSDEDPFCGVTAPELPGQPAQKAKASSSLWK